MVVINPLIIHQHLGGSKSTMSVSFAAMQFFYYVLDLFLQSKKDDMFAKYYILYKPQSLIRISSPVRQAITGHVQNYNNFLTCV